MKNKSLIILSLTANREEIDEISIAYLKLSQNYRDISPPSIAAPSRKTHLSFYSNTSVPAFHPELLYNDTYRNKPDRTFPSRWKAWNKHSECTGRPQTFRQKLIKIHNSGNCNHSKQNLRNERNIQRLPSGTMFQLPVGK